MKGIARDIVAIVPSGVMRLDERGDLLPCGTRQRLDWLIGFSGAYAGNIRWIIPTGGYVLKGQRRRESDCDSMVRYLHKYDRFDPQIILRECRAVDTYQNVWFSLAILRKKRVDPRDAALAFFTDHKQLLRFEIIMWGVNALRVITFRRPWECTFYDVRDPDVSHTMTLSDMLMGLMVITDWLGIWNPVTWAVRAKRWIISYM